jgi:hypothetical protein
VLLMLLRGWARGSCRLWPAATTTATTSTPSGGPLRLQCGHSGLELILHVVVVIVPFHHGVLRRRCAATTRRRRCHSAADRPATGLLLLSPTAATALRRILDQQTRNALQAHLADRLLLEARRPGES